MKFFWRNVVGLAALAFSAGSEAALLSFDLDQSNQRPDGQPYVRVTIDDEGRPDRINFHVSLLGSLLDSAGHGFGIDEFGFNSDFRIFSSSIVGLPKHWKYDGRKRMDGFGRFDATVETNRASARVDSLAFSIKGIRLDTILDYLDQSSGYARNGNFFFAVHVAGLGSREFRCLTDLYFAGSKLTVPPPVPVPLSSSASLLLGGLGALAFALRRGFAARELLPRIGTREQLAGA
jgi:hypothetical protein